MGRLQILLGRILCWINQSQQLRYNNKTISSLKDYYPKALCQVKVNSSPNEHNEHNGLAQTTHMFITVSALNQFQIRLF